MTRPPTPSSGCAWSHPPPTRARASSDPRDDQPRACRREAVHSARSPPISVPSPASIQYSADRTRSASLPTASKRTIQASRSVAAGASGRDGAHVSFGATHASAVATGRMSSAAPAKRCATIDMASWRAPLGRDPTDWRRRQRSLAPAEGMERAVVPERDPDTVAQDRHAADSPRPRDRPAAGPSRRGDRRRPADGDARGAGELIAAGCGRPRGLRHAQSAAAIRGRRPSRRAHWYRTGRSRRRARPHRRRRPRHRQGGQIDRRAAPSDGSRRAGRGPSRGSPRGRASGRPRVRRP